MAKRLQKELDLFKEGHRVKFTFGVLVCTILAMFSLVIAAFTMIPITHYYLPLASIIHPITFWSAPHTIQDFTAHIQYIPQIPAIVFMTIILGKRYSFVAIALYILTGLFLFPVFSLGGGIAHIFQYSFGYVIGFFPMVFILSKYLNRNFHPKKVFFASLYSLIALHLIGMIYLVLICAIRHDSFGYAQDLLYMMTFAKFGYDLIFTFMSVYIANFVRKIVWLAMD